ncbi:37S ribosomal protein S24, mitochondrial [Dimargaris cristalligena]|nr:37S ribosomal protein S24, mitochondrial [Dimargaris cristalligena]
MSMRLWKSLALRPVRLGAGPVGQCFSTSNGPQWSRKKRYQTAIRELEEPAWLDEMPGKHLGELTRPGQMLWLNVREVEKYIHKLKTEVPQLAVHARPAPASVTGSEAYVAPRVRERTALAVPTVDPANPVLRFRSANYALETNHSRQQGMILTVSLPQLQLTDPQHHKLKLLVGVEAYRFESEELVLGCNDFSTRAENKSHLVQILRNLLQEVRENSDMFTDVPAPSVGYLRRKKFAMKSLRFPAEWVRPKATPGV